MAWRLIIWFPLKIVLQLAHVAFRNVSFDFCCFDVGIPCRYYARQEASSPRSWMVCYDGWSYCGACLYWMPKSWYSISTSPSTSSGTNKRWIHIWFLAMYITIRVLRDFILFHTHHVFLFVYLSRMRTNGDGMIRHKRGVHAVPTMTRTRLLLSKNSIIRAPGQA